MTLGEFVAINKGKRIERSDPKNPYQCMDLAYAYVMDVLGLPMLVIKHLYAYQVYTDPTALTRLHFDLITPDKQPLRGDLIVWGKTVGVAGHIAVHLEGERTSFKSFDQNWPVSSACHIQAHTPIGVIGYLRPKGGDMSPPVTDGDVFNYTRWKYNNPTYQPTGEEFRYYKTEGWKVMAEETRVVVQEREQQPDKKYKPYTPPVLYEEVK